MPRNSSGTYTLPAGNPVVTGTTISSTWANTTLSDIASEMTDSLDRSGKGAMLAALQLFSGVVGSPGLSWSAETTSGLYRAGAGDFRYSISSTDKLQLITTGLGLPAAGVAATPSLYIIGDPNTGLYSVGADDLGFTIGGTLRLDISTTAFTATLPWRGQDGSLTAPAFSFSGETNTGWYRRTAGNLTSTVLGVRTAEINAGGLDLIPTTAILSVPAGSSSAPSIVNRNETNTGVYFLTGSIGFAIQGASAGAVQQGSFTGTLTGMTGTVTGTVNWQRVGQIGMLWITSDITGTSNSSSMTMTGLPGSLQPSGKRFTSANSAYEDNTITDLAGSSSVTGGTITFYKYVSGTGINASVWSTSGTKGLMAGWCVVYSVG